MAWVTFVLTGDKHLDRKLRRLLDKDAKKAIRRASKAALKPVLQQAKQNAPTDTGTLEENIKLGSLRRSRKYVGARVTSGMAGKGVNTGKAYYGAFLEYGTKERKHKRTGKSVGAINPGLGFMKLSADQKRTQAQNIFRSRLAVQIESMMKHG